MPKTRAFTLIEILTVIAIIAILAAIIFPSFSRARAEAFRNGDFTAMNELRNSVLLYREDQGAYPPQLLGYVTLYSTGPNAGSVVPADRIQSYLFPRRVSNINSFRPANNRTSPATVTVATYPNADPRAVGSVVDYPDLNGNGVLGDDDTRSARQAFAPTDGCVTMNGLVDTGCAEVSGSALFYSISGYDVARNPYINPGSNPLFPQHELRYSLFWSCWGLGLGTADGSGCNGSTRGSANDDPRQLGYNNPPDDTVITWNSWWRDWESTSSMTGIPLTPAIGRRDIVLTVGGSARPADSRALFQRSWRFRP